MQDPLTVMRAGRDPKRRSPTACAQEGAVPDLSASP